MSVSSQDNEHPALDLTEQLTVIRHNPGNKKGYKLNTKPTRTCDHVSNHGETAKHSGIDAPI